MLFNNTYIPRNCQCEAAQGCYDVERDFSERAADRVFARKGPDVEEYAADGARVPQSCHMRMDSDVVNNELWKLLDRLVRRRRRRMITKKNTLRQRRMNMMEPSTPAKIPTVAAEVCASLNEPLVA